MTTTSFDFTDFYVSSPDDPKYDSNNIILSEIIDVIIQKYKMIIFTNKGEVLGEPNLGSNLLELLYETKVSESYVKDIINEQIKLYIPELLNTNYTIQIIFMQDTIKFQDIMFILLKIADYSIYAQFGYTTNLY